VLILGIDTSGRQGSVALLRVQDGQLLTLELELLAGGQYSEALVPTIAGLLLRHSLEKSAIGLIAVASGPGSFTGLRVAIATVKGLAEAFATPVAAVSVLEAIALASAAQGKVIAAMDAQRSEVFSGEYIVESARPESATPQACRMQREAIASFADFTRMLAAGNPARNLYTPDDGLSARFREAGFDAHLLARPSAEAIARIAHRKFLAGDCADVATLDANYLRRSDAEIFSVPKPAASH
jgi:tRNA threonylcarbamoyladenosine biosynthesis protein TsaB